MPTLSLVLPVYNEAALVRPVVEEWLRELDPLGVSYEVRLYDDGSTDGSAEVLAALAAAHPQIVVVRQANRGHGPTVLRGYREARGEWVFQADSDGEIETRGFRALWDARLDMDIVVGRRVRRASPLARRIITGVSMLTVRLLFGAGVHDVNCPFRLMRAEPLRALLPEVPEHTFAPNVVLSGLAVARGLRVAEVPVVARQRRSGGGTLAGFKAFRAAARSLRQTLMVARRVRREHR